MNTQRFFSKKFSVYLLLLVGGVFFIWILCLLGSLPQLSRRYTIGLLYVPSRVYHEQFNTQLKALLVADGRFKVVDFLADSTSNKMMITTLAESALNNKDVDLVMCTGISCAQNMVAVSKRRLSKKPILFIGVHEPVKLGLVESIDKPGGTTTGLYVELSTKKLNPFNLLFLTKPLLRSILLPYAVVTDGNEAQAINIKKLAETHGVNVTLLPVDNLSETLIRVAGSLAGHDALLYLEADMLGTYGAGLGKSCSQHHITMFACSTEGVSDAALSYAGSPVYFTERSMQMIKRILVNQENPSLIPLELVDNGNEFVINTHLCIEQSLGKIDIENIKTVIATDDTFSVVRNHLCIN